MPSSQPVSRPVIQACICHPALTLYHRKVPGVGKVTQKVLAAFGMHTGADLLQHRSLLGLEVCLVCACVSVGWFGVGGGVVIGPGCMHLLLLLAAPYLPSQPASTATK